ncbi:MAG TPA: hypothetical protein VFY39_07205 [Gammaproteobacteria bacterium]|nr:hypothetical protein [Gammaproteobacteria bacterium]
MLIRSKQKRRHPDAPLRHENHARPVTRRELIAQGFMAGSATVLSGGVLALFSDPRAAYAALAQDLQPLTAACGITNGAGKIPFICFDLAGGGNTAGSNVLVGQAGGQLDVLPTAGYSKLGLPGDMIPGVAETVPTATSNGDHTDTSFGLAFHSDSAFLRGMQASIKTASLAASVNGAVIPARSENDTGNNPHNPLYGIQKAGADGSILTLCGTENTDSGGNSMAPAAMIDPEFRPTKIDRPSDVKGLVDTGQLVGLLGPADATAVLESIYRISRDKINNHVSTGLPVSQDQVVKDLVNCGYLKAADVADRFGNVQLDPSLDTKIVGPSGIFSDAEFNGNDTDGTEFRKTASVMKLVIDGFAGAGCITLGGYDYHTGTRMDGELRDYRAGRCMGACLEYAARVGVPLMLYVFSDGSLASNGTIDSSPDGRGKGVWTGDNQDTAATFFLVYNPGGRAVLMTGGGDGVTAAQHQQIGSFTADGNVQRAGTPGANNVNLLVEMVVLNYMALHGEQNLFATKFPNHGLGDSTQLDRYTAFAPIVNGRIA